MIILAINIIFSYLLINNNTQLQPRNVVICIFFLSSRLSSRFRCEFGIFQVGVVISSVVLGEWVIKRGKATLESCGQAKEKIYMLLNITKIDNN